MYKGSLAKKYEDFIHENNDLSIYIKSFVLAQKPKIQAWCTDLLVHIKEMFSYTTGPCTVCRSPSKKCMNSHIIKPDVEIPW
jgi:hypothetical protein